MSFLFGGGDKTPAPPPAPTLPDASAAVKKPENVDTREQVVRQRAIGAGISSSDNEADTLMTPKRKRASAAILG